MNVKSNHKGFTLIELVVVMALIGIILFLAVPNVRDQLFNDGLKTAVRNLVGTARELRSSAVREQVDYVLHMDLDNNLLWSMSADMTPEKQSEMKKRAVHLPAGVKFADIALFGKNKQTSGEATVKFFSRGYVQPAAIHLTDGNRKMTLVINPFVSAFKIHDMYVDVWQTSRQ
jgi:general secretion pathway protein H